MTKLDRKDILISRSDVGNNWYARLTHMPTGTVVEFDSKEDCFYHRSYEKALKELKRLVNENINREDQI